MCSALQVLPWDSPHSTTMSFPYFIDEDIEAWGGKAYSDLIIYCPNGTLLSVKRDAVVGYSRTAGKIRLSPASQDMSSPA